jgi:tetratricopeptide (TPR) repeat protein
LLKELYTDLVLLFMTTPQRILIGAVVVIVVVAGIWYLAQRSGAPAPGGDQQATTTGSASTSTPAGSAGTSTSQLTLITPDYKKPIAYSAGISSDIRAQLNGQLKIVQAELAKNPLDVKAWIDLGALHKIGGDYAAAAEYWEYLASSYTGNSVPYYSMGDLYENFLHNYVKAEADYKLAIKADPKNVNAYASLATMYRAELKDTAKAAATLAQGLAANPGNNYLLSLQADLKNGN